MGEDANRAIGEWGIGTRKLSRRDWLRLTGAGIIGGAGLATTGGTASGHPSTPGYYRIVPVHSGKAIGINDGSTDEGASAVQWFWNGYDDQHWILEPLGGGEYGIRNENSGYYLDVSGGSTSDGADVIQWPWHGGDNQRWVIEDVSGAGHRLRNVNSGKYLDVDGASTADGANIHQWSWHGGPNQRFTFEFVDSLARVDTTGAGNAAFEVDVPGGQYAIEAAGADVWSGTDEYGALVEEGVSGDTVARATVESQEDTHGWAKAGLMLANDAASGGSSAGDLIVGVSAGNGFFMQWDSDGDGYVDSHSGAGSSTSPAEIRVRKSGTTFTGEYSTDGGSTWTTIDTVDVGAANETQDVALFATSHSSGTVSRATFSSFDPYPATVSESAARSALRSVNDRWISDNPGPGDNLWARSVYHTGNMAAYQATGDQAYLDHATQWAEHNDWELDWVYDEGEFTNVLCAGQTYLDHYEIEPADYKIAAVDSELDAQYQNQGDDIWPMVDAIYMAGRTWAAGGRILGRPEYYDKLNALYSYIRNQRGESGLYDADANLWYRDTSRTYPDHTTPNGEKEFWARGNGWAFAAMARMLEALPSDAPGRGDYERDMREMAAALEARQRDDGFWNVSLDDPHHYPGPETTGTSLYTFGLAWGINNGVLDESRYRPVAVDAWQGLRHAAVHDDGFLGYVQGEGTQPSDNQPVTAEDTADFGVGVFLLAASEVMELASI